MANPPTLIKSLDCLETSYWTILQFQLLGNVHIYSVMVPTNVHINLVTFKKKLIKYIFKKSFSFRSANN